MLEAYCLAGILHNFLRFLSLSFLILSKANEVAATSCCDFFAELDTFNGILNLSALKEFFDCNFSRILFKKQLVVIVDVIHVHSRHWHIRILIGSFALSNLDDSFDAKLFHKNA